MSENEMYDVFASQLTMEYFKQNDLFTKSKENINDMVKDFAEIEQIFYKSLMDNKVKFKKLTNP